MGIDLDKAVSGEFESVLNEINEDLNQAIFVSSEKSSRLIILVSFFIGGVADVINIIEFYACWEFDRLSVSLSLKHVTNKFEDII